MAASTSVFNEVMNAQTNGVSQITAITISRIMARVRAELLDPSTSRVERRFSAARTIARRLATSGRTREGAAISGLLPGGEEPGQGHRHDQGEEDEGDGSGVAEPVVHEPGVIDIDQHRTGAALRSARGDRKSTRLNSSHVATSYA